MKHLLLLIVLSCTVLGQLLAATDDVDLATQVKAAYLFNFARFIEWPKAAADHEEPAFNLCIVGADKIARALEDAKGKTIGNRVLHVSLLTNSETAQRCHLIFIAHQASGSRAPYSAASKSCRCSP